jgi:ribose transport system ATP-binding protein
MGPVMAGPARLSITGLTKSFGPNTVLDDVSLEVAAGEIHALVGQNGSGKSTIVKILAGYQNADSGTVHVDQLPLPLPARPADLLSLGVSIVHQDLGLVESESVLSNICVGTWPRRSFSRTIDRGLARQQARETLATANQSIDLDRVVGELSSAEKVTVAVARGLRAQQQGRGIVIFDESTRALSGDSLERLYELSRRIAENNGSVLLISHNLEEVRELAHRVTVLRDGVIVDAGTPVAEVTEPELVRRMLGHSLNRPAARQRPGSKGRGSAGAGTTGAGTMPQRRFRLSAAGGSKLRDLTLCVDAGETLGVTGLPDSGYEELPALLGGYFPRAGSAAGELDTGSQRLTLARLTPGAALRAGIAVIPGDRHRDALAIALSVQDNITLPRIRAHNGLLLRRGWQRDEARQVIDTLGVRPADPAAVTGTLSGGNQQKVLIGKWLLSSPELLVLHEPTQAVDVGARADIHDALARAADGGSAVIMVTSDPAELVAVCDRVLVLRGGMVAAELGGELTIDRILDAVYPPAPGNSPEVCHV